jgi:hypothetical protein
MAFLAAKALSLVTPSIRMRPGGLFVVGIVGGEVSHGAAQWSIEGVTACPDPAGWTAWLSAVLQEVSVRTRVRWQIRKADDGNDIVLVAVDRAQELIRLYKRPALLCHLRVGDETVSIDDTLYADLVLGRRVKPDLELLAPKVTVSRDSIGHHMNVNVTVQNNGLVWVPDMKVAWVGYSHGQMPAASESLRRQLEGPRSHRFLRQQADSLDRGRSRVEPNGPRAPSWMGFA